MKMLNKINLKKFSPKNVPKTNGNSGTPMMGAVKFINQLGKKGVILRNSM